MRQLDPKVALARKRRVLQWVVHNYIKTSRPIASSTVADEAGLELSSATIRSILKDLEDEGYLGQPHTSSGRIPTDRGYRFYVDYLQDIQRLASNEKARIERRYTRRMEELDHLLSQTSSVLSHLSHKAGLVLSPNIEQQRLKRIELIPLGPQRVLAIVVTQSGLVRHWPIRLSFTPSANRLNVLNRFLNEHVEGFTVSEVRGTIAARIEQAERELKELHVLASQLFDEIDTIEGPEELYLDGALSLMQGADAIGDVSELQSLIRVVEDRQSLARVLQAEMREFDPDADDGRRTVCIRIGEENRIPELRNLSLVTTTYRLKNRAVGMLGILGDKRMEYSRMISLVEYIGDLVSRSLEDWENVERPHEARKKRKA